MNRGDPHSMNEVYRMVTEITNDCLWEWNIKTRMVFWIDGGHKRHFGYNIENAFIPQSFCQNRIHPQDKQRILAGLEDILLEGGTHIWEDEYRFERADGTYAYVRDRGYIVYDEDGTASRMIGATQDITELTETRRYMREELHDNLNQILVAAKLYLEISKWNDEKRLLYLDKSAGYINEVIQGIKKIAHELYPLEPIPE